MDITTSSCCHCCTKCFPRKKIFDRNCEICIKRLGKKMCTKNQRIEKSRNDKVDKTEVIKYEQIKRIGIAAPVRATSVHRPTKVSTSRPLSSVSIKQPVQYYLGPAIPLVAKRRIYRNPIIINQSPLKQIPISFTNRPSFLIKPQYYDLQIPLYINTSRSHRLNISVDLTQHDNSIKTHKTNSTMLNSKNININAFQRQPMQPQVLIKAINTPRNNNHRQ